MKSLIESILDSGFADGKSKETEQAVKLVHDVKAVIYSHFAGTTKNFARGKDSGTTFDGISDVRFRHDLCAMNEDMFIRDLKKAGMSVEKLVYNGGDKLVFSLTGWHRDVEGAFPVVRVVFDRSSMGKYGGYVDIPGMFVPEKKFKP